MPLKVLELTVLCFQGGKSWTTKPIIFSFLFYFLEAIFKILADLALYFVDIGMKLLKYITNVSVLSDTWYDKASRHEQLNIKISFIGYKKQNLH